MNAKLSAYIAILGLCGNVFVPFSSHAWADGTRISVASDKTGRKYFSVGSEEFRPVGVNYLLQHVGAPYQSFDMFDAEAYDAASVSKNLNGIAADGFNVVRVWLKGFDPDRGFGLGRRQISEAYAANVADFLAQARNLNLRVVLTGAFKDGMWAPKNYLPTDITPDEASVGGMNRLIVVPQMAEAIGSFYRDLLVKIKSKNEKALDGIFYFDLYNELHFDLAKPPFSARGLYETGGRKYNLDDGPGRQAFMDSAAKQWFRTIIPMVKSVDPSILVTASSFYIATSGSLVFDGSPKLKPGAESSPYPVQPVVMRQGGVDLLDIHTYPSPARPSIPAFHVRAPGIMAAEGIVADKNYPLPVIAGEFGLADKNTFSNEDAINELSMTKGIFCDYKFSGYVVWSWLPGNASALPENKALARVTAPVYGNKVCEQKRQ